DETRSPARSAWPSLATSPGPRRAGGTCGARCRGAMLCPLPVPEESMLAQAETADLPRSSRRWPYVALGMAVLAASAAGGGLGYSLRFHLPDVQALEDYRPPVMTQVLDADGNLLETFAEQHRILIGYGDIAPVFLAALLATEDANFL